MARDGMAGNFYRKNGYVNMRYLPDPKTEYIEAFENLTGGMNRFDLDYKLKGNESPFLQNLTWRNGVICSRLGQIKIGNVPSGVSVVAQFLFHGWLFLHVGYYIYAYKIREDGNAVERAPGTIVMIEAMRPYLKQERTADLPERPIEGGVFFQYRDLMCFKAVGCYAAFAWDSETDSFSVSFAYGNKSTYARQKYALLHDNKAYTPIVQINSDPVTGAGDQYQPENRLSPGKWVHFNVPSTAVATYQLPYKNLSYVSKVFVDDVEVQSGLNGYDYDLAAGTVTFNTGYIPQPHDPPINNTVRILVAVDNDAAFDNILDSPAAEVFGGAQDLCVVVGGCEEQPNAYFWSGNDSFSMNPTYFPMSQYNLAGDNEDPITAFGKQQNMLVIFQKHATGRATFGTAEINERVQITMDYVRINAEIGCDLPGSLQLVENNLVWCNRRYGVCRLKDSSAAYENNIVVISRKVNGDYRGNGLLQEISSVGEHDVYSVDTGRRYILVFSDNAYEWNYELSDYTNPSWFFHKGIRGVGFLPDIEDRLYEVTESGVVAEFQPSFADQLKDVEEDTEDEENYKGDPIEKIYTFPPRNFGSFDRLKNIASMQFITRGDASTDTQVEYTCDYMTRTDPTNLTTSSWSLVPRDLSFRNLDCGTLEHVFRRKPGFRNIQHLGVRLYNNTLGEDLSIIAAYIFYTYRGRHR